VLLLTDSAVAAIRDLTSQPQFPDETGLRIAPEEDEPTTLALSVTDGPRQGDQVIETEGAKVFLEPTAAVMLDSMALDADVSEEGVEFRIGEQ
jgi:iron-sulfur cluster assembly protein